MNIFILFKQKTAYEMRISYWSSDVCSSDLPRRHRRMLRRAGTGAKDDGRAGQQLVQRDHLGEPGQFLDIGNEDMTAEVGAQGGPPQIGRASCRERVCQYV